MSMTESNDVFTATLREETKRIRRERIEMLRKARRIDAASYAGPVLWDECPAYWRNSTEGYFATVDEARTAAGESGVDLVWLWATTSHSISLDAESIIEQGLEELYDGAEVPSDAKDSLENFLDDWCSRKDVIEGTTTWEEDTTRVVVLDAARFEEEIRIAEGDEVRLTVVAQQTPTGSIVGPATGIVEELGEFVTVRWKSGDMASVAMLYKRSDLERA